MANILYYRLTFVKSNGKTQVMDYERTDKNPQPLEPNAYIEATISKKNHPISCQN